jgi:hypothetical protein
MDLKRDMCTRTLRKKLELLWIYLAKKWEKLILTNRMNANQQEFLLVQTPQVTWGR